MSDFGYLSLIEDVTTVVSVSISVILEGQDHPFEQSDHLVLCAPDHANYHSNDHSKQ